MKFGMKCVLAFVAVIGMAGAASPAAAQKFLVVGGG